MRLFSLRLFLFLGLLLLLVFGMEACLSAPLCNENTKVGTLTINPHESPCSFHCECNNLRYTGVCSKNFCNSIARESCTSQGQEDVCVSHHAKCQGRRKCFPGYLSESLWGDCVCLAGKEGPVGDGAIAESPSQDAGTADEVHEEQVEKALCSDGQSKPCYTGEASTKGVGECKSGKQTCQQGAWSTCQGELLPGAEICNGKDDNCDGKVDESYPEEGKACTVQDKKGPCGQGKQGCSSGKLVCPQVIQPAAEVCERKRQRLRWEGRSRPDTLLLFWPGQHRLQGHLQKRKPGLQWWQMGGLQK